MQGAQSCQGSVLQHTHVLWCVLDEVEDTLGDTSEVWQGGEGMEEQGSATLCTHWFHKLKLLPLQL